ncbi:MAG TPA: adenosylmethionine--8-amino-7-oxononanoate transaminase [Gemmataceae bacterium]|jgi:adenosylmethionine-8-amino-7-oxononanoate aminotransferase|nr:adenosylmethionine--8-amino-7-oxononanoate transaminase [Gemmataceae bacterium]
MSDLLILGSDTGVGKTTFALVWLAAFGQRYTYWKPVETGPSDTENVRGLTPAALISMPVRQFAEPIAPPLAARRAGATIPTAATIAAAHPGSAHVLIESFGSPFSPLNDTELQIALIRALDCPSILVSSSALGTIGRTLQCLYALEGHSHKPAAVVLLGPVDDYAAQQISRHRLATPVFCLTPPENWTSAGILRCAREQDDVLQALQKAIGPMVTSVADLVARDREFVWHPYTSLRDADAPLVCVGARDEFLHLADGRRVIDGISSWWTILHGHRFAPLMEALRAAAAVYDHVHFAGVTHPAAVELAELLLATMPWRGGRVFYSDNGSTAVEVALKMAYQFWCHQDQPRRTRFVGFEHGYHGDTFGAMAVGRDPVFFGRFEPLMFRADILPLTADRLDDFLRSNRDEVAAIILEPLVQGAGGMRMHTPEDLRSIFEVAKRHDVLFIADEVMTGGGRLGTLWAHQAAGIAPDVVCAAKTLAGGVLSLAATLAAPHIAAAWDTDDRRRTFFHGHSFTAHPLACAVAVANWRLLTTAFPEGPARMEAFWKQTLGPLRDHPKVKEVRVHGSIAAIEVRGEEGYLADVGPHLRRTCLAEGVLLRPLGSVLYAMPPLLSGQDSLERIARAMIRAVKEE